VLNSQTHLYNTAKHWHCHTSSGIHHKIHRPSKTVNYKININHHDTLAFLVLVFPQFISPLWNLAFCTTTWLLLTLLFNLTSMEDEILNESKTTWVFLAILKFQPKQPFPNIDYSFKNSKQLNSSTLANSCLKISKGPNLKLPMTWFKFSLDIRSYWTLQINLPQWTQQH